MSFPKSSSETLKDQIKAEAINLGFVAVGLCRPDVELGYAQYLSWITKGRQAGMTYLSRQSALDTRRSAKELFPECKSVLSLAFPYSAPSANPAHSNQGRIAAYALTSDYHDHLKSLAIQLITKIEALIGHKMKAQVHVDTAPILEKAYARQAGLGWIGRNSLLLNPDHGSYLFLCEILLEMELEPDHPCDLDGCGSCQLCVQACPTQAILPDRTIDARRCLSYLTIENRGPIPQEFRSALETRVFGCDTCQSVCPYNTESKIFPQDNLPPILLDPYPDLSDSFNLTREEFDKLYGATPISRAKYAGFRRNVAIAMGNSRDPNHYQTLQQALGTEDDPILGEAIAWALDQLGS